MNILGYSGLHNSIAFRREHFPDLTEQEYRMCQGLDSAACIFVNGKLIAAAEEERFNGDKYTCDFPINAINFCLEAAKLNIHDIDFICHGFDYKKIEDAFSYDATSQLLYKNILSAEAQHNIWISNYPTFPIASKFLPISHHLAHAASAFYPSDFKETLILVCDGIGEKDSISLYLGKDNQILPLQHYNYYSSLGILYSQITVHLGFLVNSDEYKVMGLAPYGDPNRYLPFFKEIVECQTNGEIYIKGFKHNKTRMDKLTGRGFRLWLTNHVLPERKPNEPVLQEHKDLAAALQKILEISISHLLNFWQTKTGSKNLCIAGGVALNCSMNGLLLQQKKFSNIFIPPAASDAGTAIGAALVKIYSEKNFLQYPLKEEPSSYGPACNSEDCELALKFYEDLIIYRKLDKEELLQKAATYLATGKIIAWVQGRMEFGPRALGNRSILADPRSPSMRDRINALVKKRESFRPFAPAVKEEQAHTYFEIPDEVTLPHMLFVVPVKESFRSNLPAITHIDGSARVQTVNRKHASLFWALLNAFEEISGIPILLNTSFNIKGQPIVRTATEAISTLLTTKIDALFLENYIVEIKQ